MPVPDDRRRTTEDGKPNLSVARRLSSVVRSALTERPACFEIDPSARAVKQRVGCGSPTACAAATFSDRSPLHDVRQRARRRAGRSRCRAARENLFLADERRSCWWSQTGSNRRPPACKAGALPTELWPRSENGGQMTEVRGVSIPTSDIGHLKTGGPGKI